ncbi:MAG: hypothetical protein Q9M15_07770 [Mariprofundaceae bacterium]|nr:hypothetical protein [Mariprofundaceae bacterium]
MADLKMKHAKQRAHKVLDDAGVKAESYRCTVSLGAHGYMIPSIPLSEDLPTAKIMSAITILACCKYAEDHANDIEKHSAAIACMTQCQAVLKVFPAIQKRNGRKAKGKPKAWYTEDLNKMIEALLRKGLSASEVWEGLTTAKVSGKIKAIEIDEDHIIIDSTLGDDDSPTHPASQIKFGTIKKKITVINKKT